MDENKTTNTNPENGAGERTFSQEDVNAIVGKRLAEEKAKGQAALAEKERQLTQRELTLTAKERLNDMGLPAELFDALNVSSSEALEKSLTTIKAVFEKYKSEPPKFVGFQPGASMHPSRELLEEGDLRKAMRLP
ncbi:hypothetical protein AALA61_14935 [Oscillospiraceae bacterium 42-9]